MPLQLSHARNRKSIVEVEFAEEKVRIVYRPGDITSDMFAELEAMEEEGSQFRSTPRLLSKIVVQWDIMDGDEEVPITEDVIATFPLDLQGALQRGIMEDLQPTEQRGGGGGNGKGGSFRRK